MTPARRILQLAVIACGPLLLMLDPAGAQVPLQPPYQMGWGDSPEKLIQWASRHAMDVRITMPGDQPELRIIRIGPANGMVPETDGARSLEGRFLHGRMIELAVHHEDPEASHEVMLARFEDLRRKLVVEYGSLSANRVLREVDDGFVIRTKSFHREPVKGLFLLLTLTTIEDPAGRSRATYSLVYRNENLRAELKPQ